MLSFHRISALRAYLDREHTGHRSVGFVPTMGALHVGHVELIKRSLAENEITVASIFVNPTQFNDAKDLQRYPRTPGKDLELLSEVGCEIVFLPAEAEMYPADLDTRLELDLGVLEQSMEGAHRPGHFVGVAQVVNRLLRIVRPNRLYLGEKDFQQLRVVEAMVAQQGVKVRVVGVPTVRDADGLALSSRNVQLSPAAREQAPLIHQTLLAVRARLLNGEAVEQALEWATAELTTAELRPEYMALVDNKTLQPITSLDRKTKARLLTAVWAGGVRLIDNLSL